MIKIGSAGGGNIDVKLLTSLQLLFAFDSFPIPGKKVESLVNVNAKCQLSSLYPDGLRQIFDFFSRKIQDFLNSSE
jgi:hypothetical protein